MSILTKKIAGSNAESNTDWTPKDGWHEARIIGIADLGEVPNKFQNGKMQAKISVLFTFDEFVEFENGDRSQKTKVERFTASLHEKAGLVTKILSPAGISCESLDEMVGQTLRLKLKQEGEYQNIVNADESEKSLDAPVDMYVPKFWLQDKEGVATGFDMITEDGVIETLRPIVETEASAPADDKATDEDEDDIYA